MLPQQDSHGQRTDLSDSPVPWNPMPDFALNKQIMLRNAQNELLA